MSKRLPPFWNPTSKGKVSQGPESVYPGPGRAEGPGRGEVSVIPGTRVHPGHAHTRDHAKLVSRVYPGPRLAHPPPLLKGTMSPPHTRMRNPLDKPGLGLGI